MSTWVGAGPLFGTGSLDGLAIGALMSGAGVLAITAPRRARARQAPAARTGVALAARHNGWLREHVMAADAAEAGAERVAQPEELGAPGGGHPAPGREGKAAGGYRSKHRRGDPIPGSAPWEDPHPGRALPGSQLTGGVSRGGALNGTPAPNGLSRDGAFPDRAFPDRAFPDRAFPVRAFPDRAFPARSRHGAHPGAGLPDEALGDRMFRSPRQPEGRRPPRHAAPSVSFGSRMTGVGSRMSSLLAPRVVASGARG